MKDLTRTVIDGFDGMVSEEVALEVIENLNHNLKPTEVQFLGVSFDGVEDTEIISEERATGITFASDSDTMMTWVCYYNGKELKIGRNIIVL